MYKILITLIVILGLSVGTQGQGMSLTIDLNDKASINKNVKVLAETETNFWKTALKLDDEIAAKLNSNNYAMFNQYIQAMKYQNYNMEKILLAEQLKFKNQRDRFMKMFLSEKQYKDFLTIVVRVAKERLKKYNDEVSIERRRLRADAAGWNITKNRIQFSS